MSRAICGSEREGLLAGKTTRAEREMARKHPTIMKEFTGSRTS